MSQDEDKLVKKTVICNACGRHLMVERGILLEDAFEAKKDWGYFSNRDLERHRFTLCEQCYDKMIEGFVIPVVINTVEEVL